MSETDIVMFAGLSGDYNEIHTNEEFALGTDIGRRMVHGLHVLAVSHGLIFRLGLFERSAIAFLGIGDWRFAAPVFVGDTVSVRITVREVRRSRSKPDRGIVTFQIQVVKDGGATVVQEGTKTLMFRAKGAESA